MYLRDLQSSRSYTYAASLPKVSTCTAYSGSFTHILLASFAFLCRWKQTPFVGIDNRGPFARIRCGVYRSWIVLSRGTRDGASCR